MVPVPAVDAAAVAAPVRPAGARAWPPWADAAVVSAAFLALAAWTWGAWPDATMDFGRELYVAWRVAEGDVLYRDVASFYGPLSPYVNAVGFRLFGTGLRTLALANMVVLAAVTAVLWTIVRRGGTGKWGPTGGALALLPLCGFAQLVSAGSFSFVAPYSHEATHGFALAAAAVLASLLFLATGRLRWAAVAGLSAGLAFLTKPEQFLAGAGASAAGVVLALWRPGSRLRPVGTLATFGGAMLVPPATAFALLATAMPAADAGSAVLGSWVYVGNEEVRRLPYFAWSMGTNDVAGNLRILLRAAALQGGVLAPAAVLAWVAGKRPRLVRPLAWVAALAVLLALAPTWRSRAWLGVARPLPLWALGSLAASGWMLRRPRGEASFDRHAARVVLATFALFLLPRMLLHSRLYHYGFVLAAPGVVLVVAALVDWIPAALDRRGASGGVFRSASLAAVVVAIAFHLGETRAWLEARAFTLGEGADRFRTDFRAPYLTAALRGITGLARPGDTLAALPEGVMLNYLLRVRTSIPYLTMLPSDMAKFGEDELLGSLQRDPPTLIALVHRDTTEFGPRFFGRDYAQRTAEWIRRHYEPAGRAGDPPFQPGSTFGVSVWRLRERPLSAP